MDNLAGYGNAPAMRMRGQVPAGAPVTAEHAGGEFQKKSGARPPDKPEDGNQPGMFRAMGALHGPAGCAAAGRQTVALNATREGNGMRHGAPLHLPTATGRTGPRAWNSNRWGEEDPARKPPERRSMTNIPFACAPGAFWNRSFHAGLLKRAKPWVDAGKGFQS